MYCSQCGKALRKDSKFYYSCGAEVLLADTTEVEASRRPPTGEWEKLSLENFSFKKLRDGDYGLAKTYWVCGALVNTAFTFFLTIMFRFYALGTILTYPLLVLYLPNVLIGTWSAANRYQAIGFNWGFVAKCLTVLGWVGFLSHVFIFIALLHSYNRGIIN